MSGGPARCRPASQLVTAHAQSVSTLSSTLVTKNCPSLPRRGGLALSRALALAFLRWLALPAARLTPPNVKVATASSTRLRGAAHRLFIDAGRSGGDLGTLGGLLVTEEAHRHRSDCLRWQRASRGGDSTPGTRCWQVAPTAVASPTNPNPQISSTPPPSDPVMTEFKACANTQ